jgi:hypothetical protein
MSLSGRLKLNFHQPNKGQPVNPHLHHGFVHAAAVGVFSVGLLLPGGASAATERPSTATLVGAITCGDAATTPASNAIVYVPGLNLETRTSGDGRFTLVDVPAGQPLTIDATTDPQHSSTSSRFDVVAGSGQTLDVGSMDVGVCPSASAPTAPAASDWELEQRPSPND